LSRTASMYARVASLISGENFRAKGTPRSAKPRRIACSAVEGCRVRVRKPIGLLSVPAPLLLLLLLLSPVVVVVAVVVVVGGVRPVSAGSSSALLAVPTTQLFHTPCGRCKNGKSGKSGDKCVADWLLVNGG
jgi:hypothetical protein